MQRNSVCCSSAADTYFTLAYHFCQELHRLCPWYFTYPMLCDTVQVSVLALHRIDAATPFQAHEIVLQHHDDIQVASVNSQIFQ